MMLATLIIGAIVVIFLAHDPINNYFSYALPIEKFVEYEHPRTVEKTPGSFEETNLIYKNFSRISDTTVRVIFDGKISHGLNIVIPEFYHEEDYSIGQTILVGCGNTEAGTSFDYYELVGITEENGTDYFDLVWGIGFIPDKIACKYPDIIPFTKNLHSPYTVPIPLVPLSKKE